MENPINSGKGIYKKVLTLQMPFEMGSAIKCSLPTMLLMLTVAYAKGSAFECA